MEGRNVAHYQIETCLGSGGMGVVYRATDTRLGRAVALKFLPPHVAEDEESKRRFMQEARAASGLDHPNLCPVYDIGTTAEGEIYIAMPCYEGETLKETLRRGPLPVGEALDVLVQMAEGIREAHEHGIVHRDLKPANVFRTHDGRVKILDFGLAKLLDDASLTRTGTTIGTYAYMSPEQALGDAIDYRADLWALGVVLYECLTGELPFAGDGGAATLHAIAYDDTPQPSRVPGVPRELDGIVAKCLARDRYRRYQSAGELIADLRGARAQLGLASTGEVSTVLPRWRPRRLPWRSVLATLVAVVAIAVAYFVWARRADGADSTTVAVLPFTNLTGDPSLEYVGVGLSAALTSRLSELSRVHVLSRTQVTADGEPDPASLTRNFGVDTLVEADLLGSGAALRVALRITASATGRVLWSEPVAGDMEHLIGLQEQLVKSVTRYLELPVSFTESLRLRARPTSSEQANNYYLEGLSLLDRARTAPELRTVAVDRLERAVELDSQFARAWAALADAHYRIFRGTHETEHLGAAEDAARHGIELDEKLPEARLALAEVLTARGRPQEARRQIQDILGALPEPADAYRILAWSQYLEGRSEEAVDFHRAATQLAPEDWVIWQSLGVLLVKLGRFDEAEKAYRRAIELVPAGVVAPRARLASLMSRRGDYEQALAVFEALPGPIRDPVEASNIGTAYYYSDRPDRFARALEYFELAVELAPERADLRGNLASVYAKVGQHRKATAQFRAAYDLQRQYARLNPLDLEGQALQAQYAALAKDCDGAVEIADEVRSSDSAGGPAHRFIAFAYAICNAREPAIESAERAVELGIAPSVFVDDEEFAFLRGDPRFARLIEQDDR